MTITDAAFVPGLEKNMRNIRNKIDKTFNFLVCSLPNVHIKDLKRFFFAKVLFHSIVLQMHVQTPYKDTE